MVRSSEKEERVVEARPWSFSDSREMTRDHSALGLFQGEGSRLIQTFPPGIRQQESQLHLNYIDVYSETAVQRRAQLCVDRHKEKIG